MIFEALPARYGDCLLITIDGTGGRTVRMLVDGGPRTVFKNSLKPRIEAEREALGNDDADPLVLDIVMVSHIDEDHIAGIIDLLSATLDADERRKPRMHDVTWLLHNSFDGLIGEGEGAVARTFRKETVLAGLGGEDALLQAAAKSKSDHTALLVLQSYPQGSKLASLAGALQIARNPPDQTIISYEFKKPRVFKVGKAKLRIVGPLHDEIVKLREKWGDWREKNQGPASLVAYLDKSVPNLSSIVGILEAAEGRVLLTGDARGDTVLKGLEKSGDLPAGGKMHVDILKLPHHGSIHNVDLDFFERIHADHYVASGDGTYGNPDRATLELLAQARPNDAFTVHITYPAKHCDDTHKTWSAAGQNREPYKPSEHSLVGLFRTWKTERPDITVMQGPVKIEL